MTQGIVSAGYEGRTIEEFLSALQRQGVQIVVDVRLNAISRKPGFSKTRLREALARVGIDYVHLRALGNPKENRQPFHTGRIGEGRRAFREVLRTPAAEAALRDLAQLASEHTVAVLCFEHDPETCHRQVLIDEVVRARQLPASRC